METFDNHIQKGYSNKNKFVFETRNEHMKWSSANPFYIYEIKRDQLFTFHKALFTLHKLRFAIHQKQKPYKKRKVA